MMSTMIKIKEKKLNIIIIKILQNLITIDINLKIVIKIKIIMMKKKELITFYMFQK